MEETTEQQKPTEQNEPDVPQSTELVPLEKNALALAQRMSVLVIKDQDSFDEAAKLLKEATKAAKEYEAVFDDFCDAKHKAWKRATSKRAERLQPIKEAIVKLKDKTVEYAKAEQERLEREAEERAKKEQAEKDKRLASINRRLDKLMGQHADLQEQIVALEAELENPETTEEAAGIIRSKLEGLRAKATSVEEEAALKAEQAQETVATPTVAPPTAPPKTKGLSFTTDYDIEVVNPVALCKAIGEGFVPATVVQSWSLASLKQLHKAGVALPGCKITEKKIPKVSGR